MDLFDANQGQTVQLNVEKIDEESESGTSNQQSIGLGPSINREEIGQKYISKEHETE